MRPTTIIKTLIVDPPLPKPLIKPYPLFNYLTDSNCELTFKITMEKSGIHRDLGKESPKICESKSMSSIGFKSPSARI